MSVRIKCSKTDKKNTGFDVVMGCTGLDICGHCALLDYMHSKDQGEMLAHLPLFVLQGSPLSKEVFVTETRLYLALIGQDPSKFSGHSYRSGCATSAAMAGLSDWEIKLMGRWTSDAYQRYIRAPVALLASFAQRVSCLPGQDSLFSFRNPYVTNAIS